MNQPTPENTAMLDRIWTEIQYIRTRLDGHIESNEKEIASVKKDVSKISSEMSGHRVKVAGVISVITIIFASTVAWIFKQFGNTP